MSTSWVDPSPVSGEVNGVAVMAGQGKLSILLVGLAPIVLSLSRLERLTADGVAVTPGELLSWVAGHYCRVTVWRQPGATDPAAQVEFNVTPDKKES